MTILRLSGFLGENRAVHPLLLNDSVGVQSTNQKPGRGDLRPWREPVTKATIPLGRKTIYRMGRDVVNDSQYWLSWPTDVNVVVAPNAADNSERTYFTGNGTPKWTDNLKAIASTPYPTAWRELGVPTPGGACTCNVTYAATDPDLGKYQFKVLESHVTDLKPADVLKFVVADMPDQFITLAAGEGDDVTQASLQLQIDPLLGISSSIVPKSTTTATHILILSDAVGKAFSIEKKSGTTDSYAAADVTFSTWLVNALGTTGAPITASTAATANAFAATAHWVANAKYEVTVNGNPPMEATVLAGSGTFPAAVTGSSLADSFGTFPGLLVKVSSDGSLVTFTTELTGSEARISIRRIYPKSVDKFTKLAASTKVVLTEKIKESIYYTFTYVTDIGEESAPAPVSLEVIRAVGEVVEVSGLLPPPSGSYGINRIRLYRTQTGSTSTEFFYLGEVGSTLTTFSDTGQDLGEVLPTLTWEPAPADLKNLTAMWNGMMAGITGRAVRFCESYVPYAWPIGYEVLPPNATPVAMATFGQTLVVLTNESPIIVTGGGPDALDVQPMEFSQACMSAKSAVDMGVGVAWAAPDGLAFVGQGGARILTEGVLTRDDWQALNPTTIIGCMYERRYFGFYTDSNALKKCFILDPANPAGMYFLDFGADAVFVDPLNDALFVLNGGEIQKFDSGALKTVEFKSKVFRLPKPVTSFACAEVRSDAYPVQFSFDLCSLRPEDAASLLVAVPQFTFLTNTSVRYSVAVESSAPFRLPAGYLAQEFQIEVSGTTAIQGVSVAHSVAELAQV